MKTINGIVILIAFIGNTACIGNYGDMSRDRGGKSKDLSQLKAGIWVDPNGCEHWIVDDGNEGYLSARLDRHTGKPVCKTTNIPNRVTGPYRPPGMPDVI